MSIDNPHNYIEPKVVNSLEGINSFEVPNLLVNDLLSSINQSVNTLLSSDYSNRYNALLYQIEIKNLSKESFLKSISYYTNYISLKKMFEPSELAQVLSDLYDDLDSEIILNICNEEEDLSIDSYDKNILELKRINSELKSLLTLNKKLILNNTKDGKSYTERLVIFSKMDLYINANYEDFKNKDIIYLDMIQRMSLFNYTELMSVMDHFTHMMIDKIKKQKKEGGK